MVVAKSMSRHGLALRGKMSSTSAYHARNRPRRKRPVFRQSLVDFYPGEVRFIQEEYETAKFGKVDIYVAFVEKGLGLLSASGSLGFIVPNKFMQADYGVGLRQLLAGRRHQRASGLRPRSGV